jgi:hypothetical protein
VLAKLLGALFGAKATAATAALILAGALVSGASQSDEPAAADELPPPVLTVITPAVIAPAATRAPEPTRAAATAAPPAATASTSCTVDARARDAALATIRASFDSSRAALVRLGGERTTLQAATTMDRADAMLAKVDRAAEQIVAGPLCAAEVRDVTERTAHAMEMIVDLARSATAPTPTPRAPVRPKDFRKPHH